MSDTREHIRAQVDGALTDLQIGVDEGRIHHAHIPILLTLLDAMAALCDRDGYEAETRWCYSLFDQVLVS